MDVEGKTLRESSSVTEWIASPRWEARRKARQTQVYVTAVGPLRDFDEDSLRGGRGVSPRQGGRSGRCGRQFAEGPESPRPRRADRPATVWDDPGRPRGGRTIPGPVGRRATRSRTSDRSDWRGPGLPGRQAGPVRPSEGLRV